MNRIKRRFKIDLISCISFDSGRIDVRSRVETTLRVSNLPIATHSMHLQTYSCDCIEHPTAVTRAVFYSTEYFLMS